MIQTPVATHNRHETLIFFKPPLSFDTQRAVAPVILLIIRGQHLVSWFSGMHENFHQKHFFKKNKSESERIYRGGESTVK